MKKLAIVLLPLLFLVPSVSSAAGLTSSQVSAIIGLLRAFNADEAVVLKVQSQLGGNALPTSSISPAIAGQSGVPAISTSNSCGGQQYPTCTSGNFVCPRSGLGYCESTTVTPQATHPTSSVVPAKTTNIPVEVATLSGSRLVDPGVTTFRFYITNNSGSQILTITAAELQLTLGGGAVQTAATKISINGSAGYLETKPLINVLKAPGTGTADFTTNPLSIMPLAKATLDVNIFNLGGSFDTGTSATLTIQKLHTPNTWATFNSLPLQSALKRTY